MVPPSYRERTYSAGDGLPLFFRDYGPPVSAATPVLCLGGLTRNSKDFHGVATRLAARGRRVVCPDYRGRGRSAYDPDWRHYRPETYVEDLRHLLAAAGLHRVAVIGTSLGGVLAMALAAVVPGSLRGAVLNDIGPEIPSQGLAPVIAYMRDPAPLPDWSAAAEKLRRTFPDFPAKSDKDWEAIARATYREDAAGRIVFDWDPAIVKPLLVRKRQPMAFWALFRALGQRPVLALRGALSTILTPTILERMAAEKPDLQRVTVPEVGHAPSLAEPEAREALDTFLVTVDG